VEKEIRPKALSRRRLVGPHQVLAAMSLGSSVAAISDENMMEIKAGDDAFDDNPFSATIGMTHFAADIFLSRVDHCFFRA
jgi:hypothetical protein